MPNKTLWVALLVVRGTRSVYTPTLPTNFLSRMANGGLLNVSLKRTLFWAFVMNWGTQGLGTVVSLGLAVMLGPTVFGIVAIAIAFVSLFQLLTALGMEDALVQRKDLHEDHLNSAFWLVLCCSLALTCLSFFSARWWALLNHQPEVENVLRVLSLRIPIYGLTIVQRAVMVRNLEFKGLAYRSNVAEGLGGVVGIGMAASGFGVWSLVGQHLARELGALALLWRLSTWRPRARFSVQRLRELVPFSLGIFAALVGSYASSQADVMLLGLFFGPTAVGLYRLAERVSQTVLTVISRAIEWVSMPRLATLQHDRSQVKTGYLLLLKINVIATAPIMLGLAAASGLVVNVLGAKWYPAAWAMALLCGKGCLESATFLTGSLLRACAKPMQEAGLTWSFGAINAVMLLTCGLALKHSVVEAQVGIVALCKLLAFAVLYVPINMGLAAKVSGASIREIGASLVSAGVAAITAFLVIGGFDFLTVDGLPAPATLGLALVLGAAGSAAALLRLEPGLKPLVLGLVGRSSLARGR